MEDIQTRLEKLEDYSAELEADILATQEQLLNETDRTHVIFLDDHLRMLRFELDKTNADVYLERQKQNVSTKLRFPIFHSGSD